MKRFSATLPEDREFEIAGEVFKWRYPYWEDIVGIFDTDLGDENGGEPRELTFKENVDVFIERIALFIPEEDRQRWVDAAHSKEKPIPYAQFSELYRWLLEVGSGRPTEQPSPSESGDGTTAST